MNKEEIRHFKSLLRQGSLRHMSIILDDKFQKELLNIIKDYENLQKQNTELKEKIILLQASEPMLEFAKQTYKDNRNKLKAWLEEVIDYEEYDKVERDTFKKVLSKIQEIEGGTNE